jgi:hypothetical protein
MNLLTVLREEKTSGLKGGIYHLTQIKLAYNSNRIEGSKLSEEQTRYIFETNTIFFENGETTANVDDIVETVNHFSCFDYMLDFENDHKFFYYRSLADYPRVNEYLTDTCLSA